MTSSYTNRAKAGATRLEDGGIDWAQSGIKCHVSSPTLFWRSQYWKQLALARRSSAATAIEENWRTKNDDQKRRKTKDRPTNSKPET